MELYCAGTAHENPQGRSRITHWLQERIAALRSEPSFIAVECDPALICYISDQRKQFILLALEKWPTASKQVLEDLSRTIVCEMDAHKDVLPNVETLNVDIQRPPAYVELTKHRAEIFISTLEQCFPTGLPVLLPDVFKGLANERSDRLKKYETFYSDMTVTNPELADKFTGKTFDEEDRNSKFHRLLMERISSKQDPGRWAAFIVGADHLKDSEGTVRQLLENDGVRCHVTDLAPEALDIAKQVDGR